MKFTSNCISVDSAQTLVSRDRLVLHHDSTMGLDPEACAVDAFTFDWGTQLNYAFPPFS